MHRLRPRTSTGPGDRTCGDARVHRLGEHRRFETGDHSRDALVPAAGDHLQGPLTVEESTARCSTTQGIASAVIVRARRRTITASIRQRSAYAPSGAAMPSSHAATVTCDAPVAVARFCSVSGTGRADESPGPRIARHTRHRRYRSVAVHSWHARLERQRGRWKRRTRSKPTAPRERGRHDEERTTPTREMGCTGDVWTLAALNEQEAGLCLVLEPRQCREVAVQQRAINREATA